MLCHTIKHFYAAFNTIASRLSGDTPGASQRVCIAARQALSTPPHNRGWKSLHTAVCFRPLMYATPYLAAPEHRFCLHVLAVLFAAKDQHPVAERM